MSDPRDRILGRLRSATALEAPELPPTKAVAEWTAAEKLEMFTRRLEAVRAEIHRTGVEDWPGSLWALCRNKGLRTLLHGADAPIAAELTRSVPDATADTRLVPYDRPVEHWKDRLFDGIDGAVTSCVGAIAETGTLILWPTPAEPRLMSLVPPVHFVVLDADRLFGTFAEAMERLSWATDAPTNALLISGPSKSADIEQTLAYGVHGPRELVVLVKG